MTVVLLAMFLYPIVQVVRLSFTRAGLVGGDTSPTLASYRHVLGSPMLVHTLSITVIFVAASVVFQLLLGLLVALLLDEAGRRGLRGTVVARTAVLSAWAIPGVVIGAIWGLLYQESPSGVLNGLLSQFGFSGHFRFLSDPQNALVSAIVANVWRGTAISMILIYAGLQTIPRDLLEAAAVDGAGGWRRLWSVVLPLLLPILTINLVVVTVETFNTFDMVLALTRGGPGNATEVLALRIYDEIFTGLHLGTGAVLATVLMAINAVLIVLYLRVIRVTREVS